VIRIVRLSMGVDDDGVIDRGLGWFVGGLFLGPIGLILVLVCRPDQEVVDQRRIASGEVRRCPGCAELIRPQASVCPSCRSDIGLMRKEKLKNFRELRADLVTEYGREPTLEELTSALKEERP
jgi:hypothetical protein